LCPSATTRQGAVTAECQWAGEGNTEAQREPRSAGGYDTLPGTIRTLSVRTIRWPPTKGVSMAIGIWISAEVKSIAATVPSAKMHPQETGYVRDIACPQEAQPGWSSPVQIAPICSPHHTGTRLALCELFLFHLRKLTFQPDQ